MKKQTCYLLIVFSLFYSNGSYEQVIKKGRESMKATVNIDEAAKYYEEHPLPLVRKAMFEEEEKTVPNRAIPDPSLIFLYNPVLSTKRVINPYSVSTYVTNASYDTFSSSVTNGTLIPPDTHGAVDSNRIVAFTNQEMRIQNRNGGTIHTITLDGIFTSVLPQGPGSFDPRIHFDPYSNRWLISALAYGQTSYAQLMIGASATTDPNGSWHIFSVIVDTTGVNWLDFDNLGFNKQWIVVSGNWFGVNTASLFGAEIYVFNKDSVLAGVSAPYTAFNKDQSFSFDPAITYDTAESSEMLFEKWKENEGMMHLGEITGTPSSPVYSDIGYPSTTNRWTASSVGESDFAPQAGNTNKIQTGDDRIYNLSERNGKLWASHTVFFPSGGAPTRSSIQWWEIDTTGTVIQNGLIDDPTNKHFYAYSSIAVNINGDAIIGYSAFSKTTYPYCDFSLHMHTDPDNYMSPGTTFKHGLNSYVQRFGGTQNRWGDYSGTCIDPTNNIDFWTIQESTPAAPANYWDVWWAHLQTCYIIDTFAVTSHNLLNTSSDTITYVGNSTPGATYAWSFNGGTATPDTGIVPQIVTWDSTGMKIVSLTVSTPSGCSATYTDTIYVTNVGVPEISIANLDIDVLPNPNSGDFDVIFNKNINKQFEINLVDNDGRVVYDKKYASSNSKSIAVHTNNLVPGNYIINIIIDNNVINKKLTIIK